MYLITFILGGVVAVAVSGRARWVSDAGHIGRHRSTRDRGVDRGRPRDPRGAGVLARATGIHSGAASSGSPSEPRLAGDVRFGLVAGLSLYPAVAFGVGVVLTPMFQALFGEEVHTPEQIAGDLGVWGSIGAVIVAVSGRAGRPRSCSSAACSSGRCATGTGSGPARSLARCCSALVHYVPDGNGRRSVLLQIDDGLHGPGARLDLRTPRQPRGQHRGAHGVQRRSGSC